VERICEKLLRGNKRSRATTKKHEGAPDRGRERKKSKNKQTTTKEGQEKQRELRIQRKEREKLYGTGKGLSN